MKRNEYSNYKKHTYVRVVQCVILIKMVIEHKTIPINHCIQQLTI